MLWYARGQHSSVSVLLARSDTATLSGLYTRLGCVFLVIYEIIQEGVIVFETRVRTEH